MPRLATTRSHLLGDIQRLRAEIATLNQDNDQLHCAVQRLREELRCWKMPAHSPMSAAGFRALEVCCRMNRDPVVSELRQKIADQARALERFSELRSDVEALLQQPDAAANLIHAVRGFWTLGGCTCLADGFHVVMAFRQSHLEEIECWAQRGRRHLLGEL